MGWLPFTSSNAAPSPGAKPSSDGAYIAPDKTSRQKCWEARDAFFSCLDEQGIVDCFAEKDKSMSKCGEVHKLFESNCANSWVQYFKKRRIVDVQKEETMRELEKREATRLEATTKPR